MFRKIIILSLGLGICLSELAAAQPVRGQHLGGCYQQADAQFNVVYGGFAAWPIISCPNSGNPGRPACAPGYTLIVLSQSQANTSDGSTVGDIISLARELFMKDTYFTTWACAAN